LETWESFKQQAKQMQDALKQEEVVVERNGVKVIVRGDQVLQEIEVDGVIENRIAESC